MLCNKRDLLIALKVFIFQHYLKLTAPVNNNENDISHNLRKAELTNYLILSVKNNVICL